MFCKGKLKNINNNINFCNIIAIVVIVLLVIMPQIVLAKNGNEPPEIAELEKQIANTKKPSEKLGLYIKLSNICLSANDNRTEKYARLAYKTAKSISSIVKAAEALHILGDYYSKNKNYKKAGAEYAGEYEIRKKQKQGRELAYAAYKIGICFQKQKSTLNYRKAQKYYNEALTLAKKHKMSELIDKINKAKYELAYEQKDFKSAVNYLDEYMQSENDKFKRENEQFRQENAALQDSSEEHLQKIQEQDSTIKDITQQKELMEALAEQKELENQNLTLQRSKDLLKIENLTLAKKNREQTIKIIAMALVIGALILLIFIRGYINKRRNNKILQKKNELIKQQNEEIKRQNQEISKNLEIIRQKNIDITDSLNYAGKIQSSLLKNFQNYGGIMHDYFIFYAPKDIVSGDFYWAHKVDNKFVFTAGDCTGHSVPGAFMSMLGIALLNQVVAQQHTLKASTILEQMRSLVKSYLGQTGAKEETKDGMDMALCVWDTETNDLNFAGAYNPLLLIRNSELEVFDAVKCPVGIHTRELDFVDKYTKVQRGDRLYMFSDGYSDQFGGKNMEKFKLSRFKKLLVETSKLPMARQREKIEENFYQWKQDFVQIDDVCVLGVEI